MLKFEMKNKKNEEESRLPSKHSYLGTSLFSKGELTGEEDLVIEGQFQGKINLRNHNLIIEKEGKVKADIHVKNVTINGKVQGNIYASGKVFISKEGQMKGDIFAPRISIVDGAQFKGSVRMESTIEKTAPETASSKDKDKVKVKSTPDQKKAAQKDKPPSPEEPQT